MRVATFNLLHGVALATGESNAESANALGGPLADGGAGESPWSDGFPDDAIGHAGSDEFGEGTADFTLRNGAEAISSRRIVWNRASAGRRHLRDAIEELVDNVGPLDVLALQEVDRHQPRSGNVDQVRVAAEAAGLEHWRFVPSVRGTPGIATEGASWVAASEDDDLPEDQADPRRVPRRGPRYGIALASRWPVTAWRVKRFTPAPVSLPLLAPQSGRPRPVMVPDEPRAVVAAVLQTPYADVTVATAHLTFVPGYNARQLRDVRAFLAGMPRPLVLLGDFNTPGGIPGLATGWEQVARTPTYPVGKPRIQFDHIMAEGWAPGHLAAAKASSRAVALPISDHCALVADFPDPWLPDPDM